MTRYFDSSFVLAHVLDQAGGLELDELWRSSTRRLSSNLLRIECVVGVRRSARLVNADPVSWERTGLAEVDRAFAAMSFLVVDSSIEAAVRNSASLAECRALDAIHLATALRFREMGEGNLEVVTLDRRMAAVARKLGLVAVPA